MAGSQFDPKGMIDKMVEIIPLDSHDFHTVFPEKMEVMCQEYQSKEYEIKTDTIAHSKK